MQLYNVCMSPTCFVVNGTERTTKRLNYTTLMSNNQNSLHDHIHFPNHLSHEASAINKFISRHILFTGKIREYS